MVESESPKVDQVAWESNARFDELSDFVLLLQQGLVVGFYDLANGFKSQHGEGLLNLYPELLHPKQS
eukprot:247438-Prorocentrum_minimum.AAC.1